MSDKYDIGRIIALETAYRDLKSRIEQLEKWAEPKRSFVPPSVAEPSWRDNYPNMFDHTRQHLFPCDTAEHESPHDVTGAPV